jgi:hypothetical protein
MSDHNRDAESRIFDIINFVEELRIWLNNIKNTWSKPKKAGPIPISDIPCRRIECQLNSGVQINKTIIGEALYRCNSSTCIRLLYSKENR